MKLQNLVLGSFLIAASANATITLGFSAGTTNVANGFGNAAGETSTGRVWGIVVDSDGDGFDGLTGVTTSVVDGGTLYSSGALLPKATYEGGFIARGTSGTGAIAGGQALKVNSVTTDDILYLSAVPSTAVAGEARLGSISGLLFSGNVGATDRYAIIWFDTALLVNGSAITGNYGMWTDTTGTTVVDSTILPPDGSSLTTAANGPAGMFAGIETNKAATLTLIPEPSAALLGAIGALGLLRRRRI